MSIASALTALAGDISAARAAVEAKGGTVTVGGGSSQLATDIASISSGAIEDNVKYCSSVSFTGTLPSIFNVDGSRLSTLRNFCSHNTSLREFTLSLSDRDLDMYSAFHSTQYMEKFVVPSGKLRVSLIQSAFIYCRALEEIDAEIDISSITNSHFTDDAFTACNSLKSISFKQNCIQVPISFSSSSLLSVSSCVSVANGLSESVSDKSITFHSTTKSQLDTILGTVSLDPTETFHIFTEDASGTVTLTDFITNTKGWTIA